MDGTLGGADVRDAKPRAAEPRDAEPRDGEPGAAEPRDGEPDTAATRAEDTTRIRLDLAYDGTAFNGWARQPGFRTVQGILEQSFATLLRRHPPTPALTVAGRTDAGVHARGQVAHVDLTEPQVRALMRPRRQRNASKDDGDIAIAVRRRLSGILGMTNADVVVRDSSIAPDGFDARFSAIWREYEYRIADGDSDRDPLQNRRTTWHGAPLDADAMNGAASALLGLHDFASYCRPRQGATTIRTLQAFEWRRDDDGVLIARVQADAFCRSMVRSLVGACIAVGEGKLTTADLVERRDARERLNLGFVVAPARGLTLMRVAYPDDAGLASRAQQTRARRTVLAGAADETPSPDI